MQATPAPTTPPDKVYFTAQGTGFAFLRPKVWKMEKTKREQSLFIPTTKGHPDAVMHFFPIAYRLPSADFQQTQVVAAPDLKRSIERQWQEDIIGIPLLLTKTTGLNKQGKPDVALTGLLYSATVNKMLFRLTCNAEDFDVADAAWREAFQSLRTTDGLPVGAEDPNHKPTKAELEAKPAAPLPVTMLGSGPKHVKYTKGPVSVSAKSGGKNAVIRLPAGWVAKSQSDGSWLLTAPGETIPVNMTLASTLDSDPPKSAMFKMGAASLDGFTSETDLSENDDLTNRAGGVVTSMWRTGKTAKGVRTTCDATIVSGDLYLLLHFSSDLASVDAQRGAVTNLLMGTTIDVAP